MHMSVIILKAAPLTLIKVYYDLLSPTHTRPYGLLIIINYNLFELTSINIVTEKWQQEYLKFKNDERRKVPVFEKPQLSGKGVAKPAKKSHNQ